MRAIKARSKRNGYKLIGASLPQSIFSYFSLYILAKGFSKTDILRSLLEAWINKVKENHSEESLIQEIIERLLQIKEDITKDPDFILNDFKQKVINELVSASLSETVIKYIIKNVFKDEKK